MVLAVNFMHGDAVFLRRIYALIAVAHDSHQAHLAGTTARPTGGVDHPNRPEPAVDFAYRAITVKLPAPQMATTWVDSAPTSVDVHPGTQALSFS
jgi:hypothetical protein